jgi:hypothetical protein
MALKDLGRRQLQQYDQRQLNMPLKRQKSGWTGRETKKKGERKTGQDNCREPDKVIDI